MGKNIGFLCIGMLDLFYLLEFYGFGKKFCLFKDMKNKFVLF